MKIFRIALIGAIIAGLAAVGYAAATIYLRDAFTPPLPDAFTRPRLPTNVLGDLEIYYTVRTIITTVNAGLLICLLIVYGGIYLRTRAKFTVGLIMFATALLLYAITSNPLLHGLFRFRAYGLGPFAVLPELFTTVAVAVLLYLSLE